MDINKLSLFLGLLVGDGYISNRNNGNGYPTYSINFYNTKKLFVELFDYLYFDLFKGMRGEVDFALAHSLQILRGAPAGTTHFFSAEPTLREVISNAKLSGFGFVICQGITGRFRIKKVDGRLKFSALEHLMRGTRMNIFVSAYRDELPEIPSRADFYWVRKGKGGLIIATPEASSETPSVILFKGPKVDDPSSPFRRIVIQEEDMGLTLPEFFDARLPELDERLLLDKEADET